MAEVELTMASEHADTFDHLEGKIKVLNDIVWEGRCDWPTITDWLDQFDGSSAEPKSNERLQMLFLLSNFIYFGSREIRELLRSLYRDTFRYRVIEKIRKTNGDTRNQDLILRLFREELLATRFLPVGNPSESGSHLLYFFRQENHLGKEHFKYAHEIFSPRDLAKVRESDVSRYVFLDDLCGSGQQARAYCHDIVTPLKVANPTAEVLYYVLFATAEGLKIVRNLAPFDHVDCVVELDETFKAFSDESRFYSQSSDQFDKTEAKDIASRYGKTLKPNMPLGYKDGQLLLGFSHNVPDNTLPIIWYDEPSSGPAWNPVFPRYPKSYGWGDW